MQAIERAMHRLLRHLPVPLVSDIGARLAWLKIRFIDPGVAHRARGNLRRLFPELSEAELEKKVWRFVGHLGRLLAEFSVMHRLGSPEHIELVGYEAARTNVGKMPTIALCLHLGNWEVVASALQMVGIPLASISEVPENDAHRDIAEETRARQGVDVLSPDRNGLRRALSLLNRNEVVAIFPDEKRAGVMMAPLFGRPPHAKGNLALVAKLARHTGAQLVIGYCERLEKGRFRIHYSLPFQMEGTNNDVLADVAFLNSRIEPLILQHVEQWYYLDDPIEPIS